MPYLAKLSQPAITREVMLSRFFNTRSLKCLIAFILLCFILMDVYCLKFPIANAENHSDLGCLANRSVLRSDKLPEASAREPPKCLAHFS